MGVEASSSIEEIRNTLRDANFTKEDYLKIYSRFNSLDKDFSGTIDEGEFRKIKSLSENPILDRIIYATDKDNDGEINFFEFISGYSLFVGDSKTLEKTKFLFKVLDIDNDGFLSFDDLFQVSKLLLFSKFNDNQLRDLVKEIIGKYDFDMDEKLSYLEFTQTVCKFMNNDLMKITIE